MSESKTKRLVTTSAIALTMASPLLSAAVPVSTVLAEDAVVTKTESTADKLQAATDARDVAHKEFVDATVDATLAEGVKKSADDAKVKADTALADAEKVTADAQKVIADSTKAIADAQKVVVEQTDVIEKAENRIENIKNVKELATEKLEEAKAEKKAADTKIANANKVIAAQKQIIETANKAIEVAEASKAEPTADIKQFQKLLAAAQEDLATATDAVAKDKADGNVKTFETAIKQAQAKIDAANKIVKDSNKAIADANSEIKVQEKIVADETKISDAQAKIISEQEKAIKDNNDLIVEQNKKISDAKSKIASAEKTIKSSTAAKATAEQTVASNTSLIAVLSEVASTADKAATEANKNYDAAMTRLEKAEKDLQVKQAAVDALRAESVKEQVGSNSSSTETPNADDTTQSEVDITGGVKSGSTKFLDANGTVIHTNGFDISELTKLAQLSRDTGVKPDATVKDVIDDNVAKYNDMIGEEETFVVLPDGKHNVVSVDSTFEDGVYDIIVTLTDVVGVESDSDTDTTDTDTTETDGTTDTTDKTETDGGKTDSSTQTDSGSTSDSGSGTSTDSSSTTEPSTDTSESDVDSGSSTSTENETPKGQTSADGILTNIVFSKSSSGKVAISGKVDKTKLESDQKLEGKFATLRVSNAEGAELGKYSIASDYTFVGELSSEPKEGDKLIINYGGKTYEIEYTLDLTKDSSRTQQSVSNTTTGSASDTKTNAKASLLPSTGQRNLLGMTIAGLSLMIAGVVALFMKFRKKGLAE